MHTGSNYKLKEVLLWTRREIYVFTVIAAIPTIIYGVFHIQSIAIPWLPIALIGTAVAFIIGFKNNTTYDRMWEARKIWGAIVNSSRSWGIMVKDFVTNLHAEIPLSPEELRHVHHRMIYRHIAWLTALRFQLRQPKPWENMEKPHNKEYRQLFAVQELEENFEDVVAPYLSADELKYVLGKKNWSTQIISLQSAEMRELIDQGLLDDFRHMEMQAMLTDFYTQQGKCERIKNFPYPRQFATINLFFVWLFIILVPFGMLNEFDKLGANFVWLTIPFSVLVSWVFHTMEKIGEVTSNPFEGGSNDIPMTQLSRVIETDLREMLEETELPPPVNAVNNILM